MSARLHNRTRRTDDLLAKFRRERRWHLIPLFHLLRLSDFGREGIENSGSYLFADHMYRNRPSGRGWIGLWLDRVLLNLPASRSMRSRCERAAVEMGRAFAAHAPSRAFRLLTVPCGLPRDVRDFAGTVGAANIEYTGMDLDPAVLAAAEDLVADCTFSNAHLIQADALDRATWPTGDFDFVSSTGLGEFLDDDQLGAFYANVHAALRPGGTFFTSAAAREPRSDWLLRAFELDARYRTRVDLEAILTSVKWRSLEWSSDVTGLQTFVRAVKV
jgi:SAM-dependent methyltransferase